MNYKNIFSSRYLTIDWTRRPDGRKFRFRHNKKVSSIYIQIFRLEIGAWYR